MDLAAEGEARRKGPRHIRVGRLNAPPVFERPVEIVERKGIGHPDTVCDGVMEEVSQALSREYLRRFGFIPHYNVDKGLLVAGEAEHKLGGGRILRPMRFVLGDRATFEVGSQRVPVDDIAIGAAKGWLRRHLPGVDPDRHVDFQVELRPGSAQLAGIFQAGAGLLAANDTTAAAGYAPLSETERLVLESERFLNSPDFKAEFPETGQDVKVMGFRVERSLALTVAMPLIDRYVPDEDFYFRRKAQVAEALQAHLDPFRRGILSTQVQINMLDVCGRGAEGIYLSVLGTSAEDGDSGEVGRGNRVNGVISLDRPASAEAAAGKNPISHPGKIYNVLSHVLAQRIFKEVSGLLEVYVWLCREIGAPIDRPDLAAAQLILHRGVRLEAVKQAVEAIMEDELSSIGGLIGELTAGKYPLY